MSALLDRFCRYAQVATTANEHTTDYPSSPGQWDLAKMLKAELEELGLHDVSIDEHCIVMATVPGNVDGAPTVCFCSHMDTSHEYSGTNVKPIVHENYDGKDITLPGDPSQVIVAKDNPELVANKGKTIVTTDGTTLLGADDKAGIAIIMTLAAELMAKPEIKRGPIRVLFTCDEEIGRGTDKLDLKKIAADVAYTLDGEGQGSLECETFSADMAIVTILGKNIHPGYAKGRMLNSMRPAATFMSKMPADTLCPEMTEGREGFLHLYQFDGNTAESTLRIILRSFETAELESHAALLRRIAQETEAAHPGCEVKIEIKQQYRNMIEGLNKEPRAKALAEAAFRKIGVEPTIASIRGGTDGARLTEMGLPTPNLSAGMHNFHSPLEWACLEEMETAVRMLVELVQLWGKERR